MFKSCSLYLITAFFMLQYRQVLIFKLKNGTYHYAPFIIKPIYNVL